MPLPSIADKNNAWPTVSLLSSVAIAHHRIWKTAMNGGKPQWNYGSKGNEYSSTLPTGPFQRKGSHNAHTGWELYIQQSNVHSSLVGNHIHATKKHTIAHHAARNQGRSKVAQQLDHCTGDVMKHAVQVSWMDKLQRYFRRKNRGKWARSDLNSWNNHILTSTMEIQ